MMPDKQDRIGGNVADLGLHRTAEFLLGILLFVGGSRSRGVHGWRRCVTPDVTEGLKKQRVKNKLSVGLPEEDVFLEKIRKLRLGFLFPEAERVRPASFLGLE